MTEQSLKSFAEDFQTIQQEIERAIVGQAEVVTDVLTAIIAGGNVLLEGLPGLGKTQLVKTIGKVLDMQFSRIQFTPDLMPADVTGTDIFVKKEDGSDFWFRKGPVFSNIVLADEINRATPKTQSALLEAMQERTVTVGGNTYALPEPFFVLATQNPLEQEGTYPLPEAQLDRFLLKINVGYPDKEALRNIVSVTTGTQSPEPNKVYGKEKILEMGEASRHVAIAKPVMDSILELLIKGQPGNSAPDITNRYIKVGASPRGAQAIVHVARVYALLAGRYNVAFEDVRRAAYPTLRHRLLLNFEALADGILVDDVITELLK